MKHLFAGFLVGGAAFFILLLTGAPFRSALLAYVLVGLIAFVASAIISAIRDAAARRPDQHQERDFSTLPTTPSHASPASDKPNTRA